MSEKYRGYTRIDAMHGEYVLGKINTDGHNLHGFPLSRPLMDKPNTILVLQCRAALPPLARDGEVPFIR